MESEVQLPIFFTIYFLGSFRFCVNTRRNQGPGSCCSGHSKPAHPADPRSSLLHGVTAPSLQLWVPKETAAPRHAGLLIPSTSLPHPASLSGKYCLFAAYIGIFTSFLALRAREPWQRPRAARANVPYLGLETRLLPWYLPPGPLPEAKPDSRWLRAKAGAFTALPHDRGAKPTWGAPGPCPRRERGHRARVEGHGSKNPCAVFAGCGPGRVLRENCTVTPAASWGGAIIHVSPHRYSFLLL